MPQQLLIEYGDEILDPKLMSKDPETAMKMLISQQSCGRSGPDMLHSIIRSVMSKEDNHLKRLLYYFFECMSKDDKSFMICINQVNKDLSSPNEFVRGFVLRFISKLDNFDYVSLLLKGVRGNLEHSNSYVRMNALFCLGELGVRFDLEVEQDILHLMRRESSPEVLVAGFGTMHKLGMGFEEFLEINYPKEVLETLAVKVDDPLFLKKLLKSKFNSVAYTASCKLLIKRMELEDSMENLLRILAESPGFKHDFVPYLKLVEGYALDLLGLIDPYEHEFSSRAIDTSFRNADAQDFRKVAEFLFQKYTECGSVSEKKKAFKILLLGKMSLFASTHCVYVEDLVDTCMGDLLSGDPELEYASLMFLKSCMTRERSRDRIHSVLIEKFSRMRYGRIIRSAFDILSDGIKKSNYECLLDALLRDLSSDGQDIPFYLSEAPEVYVGAYICMCLVSMYRREWDIKAKTLGVMLRFIEQGMSKNILDQSSKSTITACVRAVLEGKGYELTESKPTEYLHVDVLEPIDFSMIKTTASFKKFQWEDPLSSKQATFQLSGLGDPLYVETNVIYSKYEMTLDILVINQTSSYLQDICFDFSFSRNLLMVSTVDPLSLQPSSATTIKVQFSILESLSSFVTATASFKYPRKEDYGGMPFIQNLDEVRMDVSEFLEEASVNFQEHWKNLEWENIYSITVKRSSDDVLDRMVRKLNGRLCDKLTIHGFVLANIACHTIQKTLVLVNACISLSESPLIEIRVRSKDEEIVKSISGLLSQYLKSMQ